MTAIRLQPATYARYADRPCGNVYLGGADCRTGKPIKAVHIQGGSVGDKITPLCGPHAGIAKRYAWGIVVDLPREAGSSKPEAET